MNKIKILVAVLLFNISLFAQAYNSKSLSLAHNVVSFNIGTDALSFNSANMALFPDHVEMSFVSLYSGISNSSISLSDYNRYFTREGHKGKEWNENDKKAILDLIPEDGLGVNSNIRLNIFSLAYRNFGFSMDVVGNGRIQVKSRDALELLFDLNLSEDFSFKKPEIAKGSFYIASKYSFAFAQKINTNFGLRNLDAFAVAAKLSYFAGHAVYDIKSSDALFKRSSSTGLADDDLGYYRLELIANRAYPSKGITVGNGLGIDLAASAIYDKKWTFSFVLENLFAGINWDENTAEVRFAKSDSIYFFTDDGVDRSTETDSTLKGGAFRTPLPVNLYLGASYQLKDNLVLTGQWKQGLSEDFGNTFTPQVGVGVEYRVLNWLPIRSGISVGGRNQFLLGMGTGIDVPGFEFSISYAMREALWPTFSNGAYFAYDLKFGF